MTDAELISTLLADFAREWSHMIGPGRTWLTPRDALEHAATCPYCDLFGGGELPFLHENPERPVFGPPIPPELRGTPSSIIQALYRDALHQQLLA